MANLEIDKTIKGYATFRANGERIYTFKVCSTWQVEEYFQQWCDWVWVDDITDIYKKPCKGNIEAFNNIDRVVRSLKNYDNVIRIDCVGSGGSYTFSLIYKLTMPTSKNVYIKFTKDNMYYFER